MDASIARDLAAVGRIDSVPFILDLCCQATGLRFATVARVTDTAWTACAVRDEINFGLEAGSELDLKTTICDEVRDSRARVIIDHVATDPIFRDHHTPRHYGFQSYISIPIVRGDGSFFGTLCALDPEPARLSTPDTISLFEGFARLIGMQLDAQDQLAVSDDAVVRYGREGVYRDQFIAILGHDLRNPLASIEAGARLLARTPLPIRETTIVKRMLDSCGRMAGLINDVLDFARGRLGAGVPLALTSDHDLEAALEQVVDELRVIHPDRDVHAAIAMDTAVRCDVPRITQLVSNLVGNALSHGDPTQPVRIDARTCDGILSIEVANGGPPIPEDRLATLFAPFSDRQEGSRHQGLGLGLFIAGEIAAAHMGKIDVVSTVEDTRFTLVMPCNTAG